MNLLEFYENKKNDFKHLDFYIPIIENDPSIRVQLEQAKNFPALKKLCGGQDEVMFMVLHSFLILPRLKWADSFLNKQKRKSKNEPNKLAGYRKKLRQKCVEAIWKVKLIDPTINEKEIVDGALKWIDRKINMNILNRGDIDDAIEFVCMIDGRVDKNRLREKLDRPLSVGEKERNNLILNILGLSPSKKDNQKSLFNSVLLLAHRTCKKKTENKDNAIFVGMAAV